MPLYAVLYHYTDDTAGRDEHRPAHRDYLGTLVDAGTLLLSGPFSDDGPYGALMLCRAGSAEEVEAALDQDPFQVHGLVDRVEVREYNAVLGGAVREALADVSLT